MSFDFGVDAVAEVEDSSLSSLGTILLTRNSRATPREIEPMTARGPRYVS